MESPLARKDGRLRWALDLAVLIIGLLFFSRFEYDWVRHRIIDTQTVQWAGLSLAFVVCAIFGLIGMIGRPREREERIHREEVWFSLIAFLIVATQYLLRTDSPWLLYAWIMAVSVRCAGFICNWQPRLSSMPIALGMIAAMAIVVTGVHVRIQMFLWESMSLGYHDIGLFARALHSAAEGNGLWVDSLGRSILGEHAFVAAWALVPFCQLGFDPLTLLILAGPLALNGTSVIIAWYVCRRFESVAAGLIAGAAWLLLPMHGCLIVAHGYGFHESYLAVPLIAWGLASALLGRYRLAAAILLVSMLIREDIALTVGAWGAYIWLVEKRKAVGAATLLIALAYFALAVFVIVPAYRGGPYPHLGFHFQDSMTSAATAVGINLSFLATLLVPMALMPLRSMKLAAVSLPAIAETMLTRNPELHNIGFQYYVPAMVVLFFAALEGWRTMARGVSAPVRHGRGHALLGAALLGGIYLGVGLWTNNPVRPFANPTLVASFDAVQALREQIPQSATVTASYRIAAHFLDARQLWTTANDDLGDVIVVHDADVIDERHPREALTRALRTGSYAPIYADYHLVALSKLPGDHSIADRLQSRNLPADVPAVKLEIGEGIEVAAMLARPIPSEQRIRVSVLWRAAGPIARDLRFGLTLGDARWGPFYFAKGAYPSNAWQAGWYYRDDLLIEASAPQLSRVWELRPVLLE